MIPTNSIWLLKPKKYEDKGAKHWQEGPTTACLSGTVLAQIAEGKCRCFTHLSKEISEQRQRMGLGNFICYQRVWKKLQSLNSYLTSLKQDCHFWFSFPPCKAWAWFSTDVIWHSSNKSNEVHSGRRLFSQGPLRNSCFLSATTDWHPCKANRMSNFKWLN